MLPILEELKGLSREEVIAEVKRCLKLSKEKYGMVMNEEKTINGYLKALGLQA